MLMYPFLTLFLTTLMTSTLMAISSFHWIMVWVALELNMISFIPLISSSSWLQESEAALKYLMFQALGSSLLLLGSLTATMKMMILIGLSTKLGAAPFFFWFPSVMKNTPWPTATLLMTWQKLAPMTILVSNLHLNKPLMFTLGAMSALIGAMGGFSQTHLRSLLAYSSIGHMGWMISAAPNSPSISIIYLALYILISLPIMWSAFNSNITSLKKGSKASDTSSYFIMFPTIISLSGLPPFLGFIPKLLVLSSFNSLLLPFILILSSLINLSYYLNFFLAFYLTAPLPMTKKKLPVSLSTLAWVSTSPLPLMFMCGTMM